MTESPEMVSVPKELLSRVLHVAEADHYLAESKLVDDSESRAEYEAEYLDIYRLREIAMPNPAPDTRP